MEASPRICLLLLAVVATTLLPDVRAQGPVAGSALSALRFDYTFPNAPGSWVTLDSLSPAVFGSMTFEAWIAMPLPTDGQYKPIVSRYPSPDRIGLPDLDLGITETNRFCEFDFQVRPDGSLNIFMGGSSAPGGASFQYGVNLNGGIRLVSMRWYHVAFTIEQAANATNPRAIRIFLDGNLIAGRDWSASPEYQRQQLQNTDPIELGRYRNPNIQLFNGWMDEIRFWDIARSAEDIKDGRFTVYAGDTPHLLAYYRANEGTGFVLTPVPYGPQDPNQMEGQLNQGTYWDVSGVQGLPQSVSLAQSTVSLIELYGSDTLYRPITFWVASLPSRGKLYRAVNLQTAGTQITSSNTSLTGWYLFYESTGPIEAGYDNFTFYVTDDSNMSSTPATVEISLTAVVGCDGQLGSGLVYDSCEVCGGNNTCVGCDGVPGSGKTIDACGVCGGMNQTCFCLDGEGQYRGFNQSELDKVLLLYEIEQAIASLEEVDAHLSSLFNQLVSSDPQSLSLGGDIDELRNWSAQCFGDFCGNLQSMFDQMSIDANETITPPVCGFSN